MKTQKNLRELAALRGWLVWDMQSLHDTKLLWTRMLHHIKPKQVNIEWCGVIKWLQVFTIYSGAGLLKSVVGISMKKKLAQVGMVNSFYNTGKSEPSIFYHNNNVCQLSGGGGGGRGGSRRETPEKRHDNNLFKSQNSWVNKVKWLGCRSTSDDPI